MKSKYTYSKKLSNSPLITKQGGRKFSSLNEFVENATFEVHTVRNKNKQGTKTGKYIDWESTKEDWKHEALNDCKDNKNDLYPTTADCAIDTLQEDHPEFCLFGSRCLNESVRKAIDKEYKNYSKVEFDDIPDEVIEMMMKNQMLEEVVF
jgi:hypothetical protein